LIPTQDNFPLIGVDGDIDLLAVTMSIDIDVDDFLHGLYCTPKKINKTNPPRQSRGGLSSINSAGLFALPSHTRFDCLFATMG
jgi:hypothetical protein